MISCSMQQLGRCSWLTLAIESKAMATRVGEEWYISSCAAGTPLHRRRTTPYHFFKHSSSGQSITTRSTAPKRAVFSSGSIVAVRYVRYVT